MSYSWGMSNSGSSASGRGGGVGKVSFGSIRLSTGINKASPMLFEAVAKGKHFPTATISVLKTGQVEQEFLKVALTEVMISSYQTAGMSGGAN